MLPLCCRLNSISVSDQLVNLLALFSYPTNQLLPLIPYAEYRKNRLSTFLFDTRRLIEL